MVEKTPGHLLFLGRIRAAFPDAPIVIVKREPLGFVASLVHRPSSGGIGSNQHLRRFAYHPAIVVYLWRGYARSLLEQLSRPDSRVLWLDYAELHQDPVGVVQRVVRHLGAKDQPWPIDTRPVNSSFTGASRRPPPATTGFWVSLLAGRECAQLYPDLQLKWPSMLTIGCSCLALPLAVILFVLLYRPRSIGFWRYLRQFARIGVKSQKNEEALPSQSPCA